MKRREFIGVVLAGTLVRVRRKKLAAAETSSDVEVRIVDAAGRVLASGPITFNPARRESISSKATTLTFTQSGTAERIELCRDGQMIASVSAKVYNSNNVIAQQVLYLNPIQVTLA